MHDTLLAKMITCCATHLPIAYHDVVMSGASGADAEFAQYQQYHIHEPVEGKAHILFRGDEREHQIILVGIDTPSPTLAAIDLDIMLFAVLEVNLILRHLITSEDHAGLYLPHKKQIRLAAVTSQILFHRQIKRKVTFSLFQRRNGYNSG